MKSWLHSFFVWLKNVKKYRCQNFPKSVGLQGVKGGQKFGEKYFYKWWKRACNNLGIDGVDLYGGTRHSTTTALRNFFTPEQIRSSGTLHTTNKALIVIYRLRPKT